MKKNKVDNKIHAVAGTVFVLVAVLHLLRIGFNLPLSLGTWQIPLWLSWLAVVLTGFLAGWFWYSLKE